MAELLYVVYSNLIFSSIFLISSCVLFILFIKKYIRYRTPELLYWGLTMIIGGITGGLPRIIDGISIIVFSAKAPYSIICLILGFFPIAGIVFIKSINRLVIKNENKRVIIVRFVIYYTLIVMIIYFTFYVINFNNSNNLYILYGIGVLLHLPIVMFAFIFIPLLIFSVISLKSISPSIRLKGKFLLLSAVFLFTSSLIFVIGELTHITKTLFSIFLYLGFVLPKPIENFFLKENRGK